MGSPILPPIWLLHCAVAAVWLYEGAWCKLLNGEPRQKEVVAAVPYAGPRLAGSFLKIVGSVEVCVAVWVLTRVAPVACALVQTALLIGLNTAGLIWARQIIHDPAGMVVKNFAFVVLVWVSASFPAFR